MGANAALYLCDKTVWSSYCGSLGDYAVGGPSAEMFVKSLDKFEGKNRYAGNMVSRRTYGNANTPYAGYNTTYNLGLGDWWVNANSCLSNGQWYWLASPSSNGLYMEVYRPDYRKTDSEGQHSATGVGFRPVVKLKSEAKLIKNANGHYSVSK